MANGMLAAIINNYDHTLYNEENISNLSIEKKFRKINEQIIYLQAENRLLYNYLIWYEKKNLPPSNETKQLLSIENKREIAEASFKVLQGYLQKFRINKIEYLDQCINIIETDNETINHLEFELITLKKSLQQNKINAEELFEFFRERIHYRETLNERKHQKTIRLRFNLDNIEKSIEKVHQIVDTITIVDYEQLKIDIEKQLKELTIKNKMLVFYKQQQSEANMKFNTKKPELFKEIRTLTTIRTEINNKTQELNHYNKLQQKIQDEINEYEKTNESLHEMTISYRVPSILNYVQLKSKQNNLHRQIYAWKRKLEIIERDLHLHQIEILHNPEKIIHPWKYLQNPSPIIFYQ